MKGLRIGKRRGRGNEPPSSPLELALRPALVDGRWQIPDRFNFTRDVVEPLARDPKRRALTFLGSDGVIEHRSFMEIAEGAAVWATALREKSVSPGDRVIVMSGSTVDWLEAILGTWKIGAVVVPCAPTSTSSQLERAVSSTDAVIVVAERSLEQTIERMGFSTEVHLFDEGAKRSSKDVPVDVPSHDSASRDLAFIVSTGGVGGTRKDVAHTHGSIFATRVQAEHWLDVGRGDAVWCTSESTSPLAIWNTIVGPWSRGAEVVSQHGAFDADERLDLLFRLGPSILCQSPAEYRALAEHPRLERFRSPRLRRLVSTGDFLDPEVVAVFEERWGMSIADGYGQAETNIVVANLADGAVKPGSFGRALPGYHVAVIDDQGNELPNGIEGDLAIRGRPPRSSPGTGSSPRRRSRPSSATGTSPATSPTSTTRGTSRSSAAPRTSSRRAAGRSARTTSSAFSTAIPAIAATAVVGIRDLQRGGHFVRAFVVAKGDGGSEQLEAELRQYASQTLPNQQVPREIVFVDELPTVGWKISRHELRERPLGGRPLWDIEMPPTTEPDAAPAPAPPPLDGEFSPRIEEPPEPVPPVAFVQEPEPIVVEPVVEILEPVEPVVVEPEPPVIEHAVVEHVVVEPVVVEPVVETPPTPEPEPVVVEPEPESHVEPEPVVAQDVPVPAPQPELTVETPPEPVVEVQPDPEPEPEPELQPVEEPEPVVAEALAQPEPLPEPEPEPAVEEIADEPEPVEQPETPALAAVPLPAPVPEPAPVAPEEAETPTFAVLDPPALPDYVIDEPDEVPPVVVPEPEPEPDLSGPLPEFVVEPSPDAAPAVAPLRASSRSPRRKRISGRFPTSSSIRRTRAPHRRPRPPRSRQPVFEARPVEKKTEETPSEAAGLYFPPVTAFPTPRTDPDDEEPRESRRAARPRPSADVGKSKRSTEPAEPGDETGEVGWMAGLSNRLSAYSLSEDEAPPAADPDDDETS